MQTDRRLLVWPHELKPRGEDALIDAALSLLPAVARTPEPGAVRRNQSTDVHRPGEARPLGTRLW
jgi:hypothetical protein